MTFLPSTIKGYFILTNYDIILLKIVFKGVVIVSVLLLDNVQCFADTVSVLYKTFFKKYPLLKIFVLNALFHSSGNFAFLVTDNNRTIGNYTIYTSSEGNIIKDGIDNNTIVSFSIKKSLMEDILSNKDEYLNRPHRLFRFLPTFFNSMSIKKRKEEREFLECTKLILRQGQEKDIFYLVNWYSDKELNKLAGWAEGKPNIHALKQNIAKGFGYDPMNLIIETKAGKPIGTIQLYNFDELNQSCKLGIRIGDREYWGKGYGEDAINTILKYAFYKLDIYRVSLKLYEYNERASNCYIKCGFRQEGKTRKSAYIDGEFYDEIIMGILKSDFVNKKDVDY